MSHHVTLAQAVDISASCYEQLRRRDDGARETLRELQRRFPDDPLVKLHGERVGRGDSGVEIVMGEK